MCIAYSCNVGFDALTHLRLQLSSILWGQVREISQACLLRIIQSGAMQKDQEHQSKQQDLTTVVPIPRVLFMELQTHQTLLQELHNRSHHEAFSGADKLALNSYVAVAIMTARAIMDIPPAILAPHPAIMAARL